MLQRAGTMSAVGRLQNQLAACKWQFKRLTDTNKVLCEAINESVETLTFITTSEKYGELHPEDQCQIRDTLSKIQSIKEKL